MKIRYDIESNMGRVRTNNEDMGLVDGMTIRDSAISASVDLDLGFPLDCIVFDGMGGYENGEVASEMSAKSFLAFLENLPQGLSANQVILHLKEWFKAINADVMSAAAGSGMGSTMAGLLVYEGMIFCLNVGDSRVYRFRYDHLKQLTTDHSERQRSGDSTLPSNLIYNAIGIDNSFIDISQTKFVAGDRFLICSDGLSDMLTDDEISNLIALPNCTAHQLVEAANAAGGNDNITVLLIDILLL